MRKSPELDYVLSRVRGSASLALALSFLVLSEARTLGTAPHRRALGTPDQATSTTRGDDPSSDPIPNPSAQAPSPAEDWPVHVALTEDLAARTDPETPDTPIGASFDTPIGISYQGGPVMTDSISLYIVWVGQFTETQKAFTRNFVASLNPSSDPGNTVAKWWELSTIYYDKNGKPVTSDVSIKGEYQTSWNLSTIPQFRYDNKQNLYYTSEWGIFNIIRNVLDAGLWPADNNAQYVAFTDDNIVVADGSWAFCKNYCGWHTYRPYRAPNATSSIDLKYFWLGMAGRQPGCNRCKSSLLYSPQFSVYGGDPLIQGALNIFAHELTETASDPTLKAWYNTRNGNENADICSWVFGKVQTGNVTNQKPYAFNVVGLNDSKFLIQSNWDFTVGKCSLQKVVPTPPPVLAAAPSLLLPQGSAQALVEDREP